jgi:hypothetical protein
MNLSDIAVLAILFPIVFYAIAKEREELGCYRASVGRQCDDEDSIYVKNTKMEEKDTCRDKMDRLKSITSYHEKGGVWKRCIILSLISVFAVYLIHRLQPNFQLYSYIFLFFINFMIIYFYHNYVNYHHFRLLKRNAIEIIDSLPCDIKFKGSESYINMSYPKLSQETINNLTQFFQYVDKDNDGYITVAEIREACGVDINNDGVISEDEKDRTSRVWIQTYFGSQDLNTDMKVSLNELLTYNNNSS